MTHRCLIAVTALVTIASGCALDHAEAPTDDPGLTEAAEVALAACAATSTVVIYPPNDVRSIADGLAAHVDPCTSYYVMIPALAADKTQPRPVPAWFRALGPRFHALAEFHVVAWTAWVHASSGTRTMELAGRNFRRALAANGYDLAAGDTWLMQELGSEARTSPAVRASLARAAKGLFEGDGQHVKGVAMLFGTSQSNGGAAGAYKAAMEGMLSDTAFWTEMTAHVRLFGAEVYADPHNNCITGEAIATRSQDLSAFTEHLARLAKAGGATAKVAADYLDAAYFPVLNAAWNTDVGYGNNLVPLDSFLRFQRLEVYATHLWAEHHSYPDRRLGFAWRPDGSAAETAMLADNLAASIQRAYPSTGFAGLAARACSPAGDVAGCSCSIAGAKRAPLWEQLATW